MKNTEEKNCIVCDGANVEVFLDLGATPLANRFLPRGQLTFDEPAYPLRVGFCHDCHHVQLMEIVAPGEMFTDYLYISSASETLREHLLDLSDFVVERQQLNHEDLVIDVGCNDGTLLSGFKRHGVRTLGVDPAKNLAEFTERLGIDRYIGFFNSRSAKEIRERYGEATVVTATNTFSHIPDLHNFVEGIKTVLRPGGALVIEAHYLVDILEGKAFDTIYHEHVSYWGLSPMRRLFARHEMEIVHAERLALHHGQIRVVVQRRGEGQVSPKVRHILESEYTMGLDQLSTFQGFAADVERIKCNLRELIYELKAKGNRVVGYGAPAKGNTLLCYLGLGPELIEFIADRSPLKQGLFTPGLHVPIVSPERLLEEQPDYVLLLAWNFVDEILKQQEVYRTRGGRFIVPVPVVQIV